MPDPRLCQDLTSKTVLFRSLIKPAMPRGVFQAPGDVNRLGLVARFKPI